MSKAAEEITSNQNGIRRSNRNRVPNPIYKQGIKELKRGLNRNDKIKEEDSEEQEDDRISEEGSIRQENGDWTKCTLEGENGQQRDLWVLIKVNKPTTIARKQSFVKPKQAKAKDVQKKTQEQPKKQHKKTVPQQPQQPQQGMGLIHILLNAAQKALDTKKPEQPIQNNMQSQSQPSQEIAKPKRESKQQRQGKLLSINFIQNQLVIQHSKLNTIQIQMKPQLEVPMQVEPVSHLSNGMSLDEIQKIFQNHKKNVYRSSIFI